MISFNAPPRSAAGAGGAGMEVGIKVDERELASILAELAHMPDELRKAEFAAVKKTTKTGKTRVKQFVGKGGKGKVKLNLPAKMIDRRIKVKMPQAQPVGRIILTNLGYPLHMYGGLPKNPPNQRGVKRADRSSRGNATWKVYSDGKRTSGRNHFVQRDKRGEVHIMVRTPGGRGGHNAKAPDDYRIKYGPGIVSAIRERNMENKLTLELGDVLEKNLRSQVDRFLNRKKSSR